ncbi:hypothetical protein EJ04DRAFT_525447 [Polyplosphaeria fusca]|uniref:C2H2-type domain-containing protein n=1 Tax=Polyplosphaeria fusca TaxID=682080 RepID=A0A9P4QTC4_9PLEO|nr:hypothetical protein EJ04DRAFT_525447 [Polyplosphaeria fusca]
MPISSAPGTPAESQHRALRRCSISVQRASCWSLVHSQWHTTSYVGANPLSLSSRIPAHFVWPHVLIANLCHLHTWNYSRKMPTSGRPHSNLSWSQGEGQGGPYGHVNRSRSRDGFPSSSSTLDTTFNSGLTCPECNTTLTGRHQRRNLNRHLQSVHMRGHSRRAQNLECQDCLQRFNRSDAVRVHRRRIHGVVSQPPTPSSFTSRNEAQPTETFGMVAYDHDAPEHSKLSYTASIEFHSSSSPGSSDASSAAHDTAISTTTDNEPVTPSAQISQDQEKFDCVIRKLCEARGQPVKCRFRGSDSMWALVQHLQSRAHRKDFPILDHLRYCRVCRGLAIGGRECQNCQNPSEVDRGRRRTQARGARQPEMWRSLYLKVNPTATSIPSPYMKGGSSTEVTTIIEDTAGLPPYSPSGNGSLLEPMEDISLNDEQGRVFPSDNTSPHRFDPATPSRPGPLPHDRTRYIFFAPSSDDMYPLQDLFRLGQF